MVAKLNHNFELYKQYSDHPLVSVQIAVDYDPLTQKVKAKGLSLYCHITKSFLDMTPQMNLPIFQGMIAQELAIIDWTEVHKNLLYAEIALEERLRDNRGHGIADEIFLMGNSQQLETNY